MMKRLKTFMCALGAVGCIMGTVVPTMAQTVDFDITVPGDIISMRASKADTEQNFYVTGVEFNKSGTLNCVSINLNNKSIYSNEAKISFANNSNSARYRVKAPENQHYYMSTYANVTGFHVKGRYTP